nr:MAG TPA: hypothetical protein [Caudoviricetes sp.]
MLHTICCRLVARCFQQLRPRWTYLFVVVDQHKVFIHRHSFLIFIDFRTTV